jgi:hypothetical protein
MKDAHGQAREYLRGAYAHLRFGRHEAADELLRAAWRVYSDGMDMDTASPDDLRSFGVLARISGVGATPDDAMARVRRAFSG